MIGVWLNDWRDAFVAQGLERCGCGSRTLDMWVWLRDWRDVGVAQRTGEM